MRVHLDTDLGGDTDDACALALLLGSGTLVRVRVVLMGGYLDPPAPGLPPWGPEMDWNVQADVIAAEVVLATVGDLTLVPLPPTLATRLTSAELPRLRAAGALGALLARQAQAHAEEHGMAALGAAHAGLPDDLLNFQYDSAACAVALGWPVATVADRRIATRRTGDLLRLEDASEGRAARVVTAVDGAALGARWLAAVERAAVRRRAS